MRRLVTALALAVLPAFAVAVPTAAVARVPAGAGASTEHLVSAAELHAGAVLDRLSTRAAYGGIRVRPDGTTLEVYTTANDASFHAAARAAAGGAPVVFTRVSHSYAALKAVQARVERDMAWMHGAGIDIVSVGVSETLNRVRVGMVDYDAAKAAALERRYPAGTVTVTPEAHTASWASREHDTSPYHGGALYTTSLGRCTTGPAVQDAAGTRYLLSAGHCFLDYGTQNSFVYPATLGISEYGTWGTFGYARAQRPAAGVHGYDVSAIKVNSGTSIKGYVFQTDWPLDTSTNARPQVGTIRAVVGTGVCMSGGFSGERCAAHVTEFDQDYYPDGGFGPIIAHVNAWTRDDQTNAVGGPGDSGGAVYSVSSGGGAFIAGHVLGGPSDVNGQPLHLYDATCWNNSFVQRSDCAWKGYFAGINSVLSTLGYTLYVP
jgi:hypothetical protein